ncbi:MAG: hypothetical protein AAB225_24660 [Acidobacteriota bacterium]
MSPRSLRALLSGIALLLLYVAAAIILLRILPPPHTSADYFVAGSVATLVALLGLFAVLALGGAGVAGRFFRRRRKG